MKHLLVLGAALGLLAACSSTSDTKPAAEAAPASAPAAVTEAPPTPEPVRPAAATARTPSRFSCTGSKLALTVTPSASTPATARIQFGTQTLTATQRPGTGAHYVGSKVDFWDKGSTASLTWQGKRYSCKHAR